MSSWRGSPHSPTHVCAPTSIRVPTFAIHAQVSIEFEFFLIAVRNVPRAQERLPADLRPAMTDQRLLHLTRNIAEHWDEVGGWANALNPIIAELLAYNHPPRHTLTAGGGRDQDHQSVHCPA
jgi:hypothetical protein